ncbi:MAG: hypothetical protein JNK02_00695 [Planctomycetes bacterium]|nr:hypothetical protein [Planctomycetota bacterium]
MRALTIDDLRTLIAHEAAPCVSLYLPTHRTGSPDDRARFAGLVRRARELLASSYGAAQVDAVCAPLEALGQDDLWNHGLDGLAVFRSQDFSVYYQLPIALQELVVVADSFHIRPLLRYLQSNERYFLLNLSQGRVSLLKGSALGLGPVDLATLPRSLADAIGVQARERVLNFHQTSTGGRGSPIFHGSGSDENAREEDMLKFLRGIDRALWDFLREETAPLLVAAPSRIAAAFQAVSRYPHLLHEHVAGSHAHAKLEDLHARAWPLVSAHGAARLRDAKERYGNLISRGRALDDASTIARFAVQGRVRDLLVDRDAQLWGRLDPATGAIELHPAQVDAHDDDVLDDIAEAVVLRGGEVLTLPKGEMPTASPVAATLRW